MESSKNGATTFFVLMFLDTYSRWRYSVECFLQHTV